MEGAHSPQADRDRLIEGSGHRRLRFHHRQRIDQRRPGGAISESLYELSG